jgi:hypothetical protein
LGTIILIYFNFGRIIPRGVVFGIGLVGLFLHFASAVVFDTFSMFIFLQAFSLIFLGLIYFGTKRSLFSEVIFQFLFALSINLTKFHKIVGKLISIMRALPLISIIEIEALYWLFSDRTQHEHNFVSTLKSHIDFIFTF